MTDNRWAQALFPQHSKHSGAAAVLKAADDLAARCQEPGDDAVLDELDRIDQADQHEWGHGW
jgi:hypothetical protein